MKIRYIFLMVYLAVFAGCSDFLDITPKDKQTDKQLFATKSGFYVAANGIYNGIASENMYGRVLTYEAIEVMGKRYEIKTASPYFYYQQEQSYTQGVMPTVLSTVWENAYSLAMACNLLIENINAQEGLLTAAEADIMRGEMLAARAFLHFDILRLFGPRFAGDPEIKTIPYNESSQMKVLPLLSFGDVAGKILDNLEEAEKLLKENDPVIANGPMASVGDEGTAIQLRYRQLRFNYYSVIALKARVSLYAGYKDKALIEAYKLLRDPAVSRYFPPVDAAKLLANYSNPDRVFSTEVLMGIYQKNRSLAYTRYFGSESAGLSFLHPHENYVTTNLFGGETQDYRYQSQWQNATGVGMSGHVLVKYKEIDRPDTDDLESEYFYATLISLLRLSEVYYIAAECEPVIADGYAWLNTMRGRRGLAAHTVVSAQDLMTRLRQEYLREFIGEGQTFYLYKRLGANMLASENGSANAVSNYSEANYMPPFPEREMK